MLSPSLIDQLERAPDVAAQAEIVLNAVEEQVAAIGDLLVFVSLLAADHPETHHAIAERLQRIGFIEEDEHPAERIRSIPRRRRRR